MRDFVKFLRIRLKIPHKLSSSFGARRSGYLVLLSYLSLGEGALQGAFLAALISGLGLGVQSIVNFSGIVWVDAITNRVLVYLVLLWALIGATISAVFDWWHPRAGTEERRWLSALCLIYTITFLGHAWLGLPGMAGWMNVSAYFGLL